MNKKEDKQKPPEFEDFSTRVELAKLLSVTSRSIANYHSLALDCVDDYYEDFPKVLNQRITNFKLSKYQSWVIWKLKLLIEIANNSNVVKDALINDLESQKQFSKQQFQIEYVGADSNEFKGIRTTK